MKNDRGLLETICHLARQEGFEFAGALPLAELADDRLDHWLEQGFAGEMEYMARYRLQRMKPAEHFAPYLSVISFILPYDATPPSQDPAIGNIARYALGDDYHDIIKKRLFGLMDEIRALDASIEARACVDTAPLLEKVAAERCGLGWQGKHSNVIREGRGSWFFLAEILINRVLRSDGESSNRCGTCDDCMTACPTGAIIRPYVVDSRLCISYLTIELRGVIPRELRGLVGNRIFGCDDCQEVCPWNRLAALPALEEFQPRPGLRERTLRDWMAMEIEEWRRTFRRSAVKRARYDGFMRNVAVAMGNHGDPHYVKVMADALMRSSPLVRAHLVWALRCINSDDAKSLLEQWRAMEADPLVVREFYGETSSPLSAT